MTLPLPVAVVVFSKFPWVNTKGEIKGTFQIIRKQIYIFYVTKIDTHPITLPEQFEENIRGGCHLNDKKNHEGLFNYMTKILNCILFCHALLKTRAETSLKNKEVVGVGWYQFYVVSVER